MVSGYLFPHLLLDNFDVDLAVGTFILNRELVNENRSTLALENIGLIFRISFLEFVFIWIVGNILDYH